MKESHVLHFELPCKILLSWVYPLLVTFQNYIININYDNQKLTINHNMVKVHIRFTFGEAQPGEVVVNPSVLSMRCLFQPIQCSLESTHMRLTIKDIETLWLLYVQFFLNNSIEKYSFHIHLMNVPPHLRWECKDISNQWVSCNWCESILIVNPLLGVEPDYLVYFVSQCWTPIP